MNKFLLLVAFVFSHCFSIASDIDVKTAAQFAKENPAEYAMAVSTSPVRENTSVAAATLSWQESQYAGLLINTWNKTYWSPKFNYSGGKGDPSKPIQSIYYYVAEKYPLDGIYPAEIRIYVYSVMGKLLGVIDRLGATGTKDVSASNFPSNAEFAISFKISGGGGPMVKNPFIGNTTIAVRY